eukprot:PhF_6_TR40767/c0_g1_i1/m.61462
MSNRNARMQMAMYRKKMMYNEDGSFNPMGYARVMWVEYSDVLKVVGGILGLCIVYSRVSIWVTRSTNMAIAENYYDREKDMEKSGKLKGSQYMVLPGRQTDDFDIGNVPARNTKGRSRHHDTDPDA